MKRRSTFDEPEQGESGYDITKRGKKKGDGKEKGDGKNKPNAQLRICDMPISDSCPALSKYLWDKSVAGDLGDDWITKHGADKWTLRLDGHLFRHHAVSSWNCQSDGGKCSMDNDGCLKYGKAGHAAAYPLYYSAMQAHAFFMTCRDKRVIKPSNRPCRFSQVYDDFKFKPVAKAPDTYAVLSSSFTLLCGMTADIPGIGGIFGMLSGISGLMGMADDGEDDAPDPDKTLAELDGMVEDAFDKANDHINAIRDALFGAEGGDQSKLPAAVQKQTYDNAIIRVFGDGQWLIQDPSVCLEDRVANMGHRMKQSLAWQTLRYGHEAFVFVDSGREDKDECEDGSANVWDDERSVCFRFFRTHEKLEEVPEEVADKLWGNDGEYNLDRLETFRNAYDRWKENGKAGKLDTPKNPTSSSLPKCFFSTKVIKGKHMTDGENYIELDEFPGQKKGDRWNDGAQCDWASPTFFLSK